MAKLTLTVDTEDQSIAVDVDGQPVDNINEINICNCGYNGEPKFYFSVTTAEKVGQVHKMTRLMASESPEAKDPLVAAVAKPSVKLPGFIEVPAKTAATKQIEQWFQSTRNRG